LKVALVEPKVVEGTGLLWDEKEASSLSTKPVRRGMKTSSCSQSVGWFRELDGAECRFAVTEGATVAQRKRRV
jgi:hypothetical protein